MLYYYNSVTMSSPFDILSSIFGFLFSNSFIGQVILLILGIFVVYYLYKAFVEAWLFYRRSIYKDNIKWDLLEMRIPREVNKSPRAMEQFFVGLHGLGNFAGDFLEKYIDGEVTLWWSMEIVSYGGEVHFYIRTPKNRRKMIEALLYAQYPTVELVDVKDYMDDFPKDTKEIYKKDYNIFGSEVILRKEDAYPIRTYEDFGLDKMSSSREEGEIKSGIDPISALLEALGGIQKEENVYVQILVRPANNKWRDEAKKVAAKLLGIEEKKEVKKQGAGAGLAEFGYNLIKAPVEHPTWAEEKKEVKEEKKKEITSSDKKIAEAIEKSMSKPGFESLIRFLYYAPKSIFSVNFARRGLLGAFNQYATPDLNSFRSNSKVETRTRWVYFPHLFVKQRVEARKQRILHNYRNRKLPEESTWGKVTVSHPFNVQLYSKTYILNTTELATLYHIPTEHVLTGPHIKRVESKRMGPPAGLPIYGEEEEK